MKLDIDTAIPLILAIPAHRSNNEGHRKMGEQALSFLFQYSELGNDENETAFNRTMIALVLSAVRAFSVERDRIAGEWKAIEKIKERRETLLQSVRNLSPLSQGNYWAKTVSVIVSLIGPFVISSDYFTKSFIITFIIITITLELLSKSLEHALATFFEKKMPIEKAVKWELESIKCYKKILKGFLNDALLLYRRIYPQESIIDGYDINDDVQRNEYINIHSETHFWL